MSTKSFISTAVVAIMLAGCGEGGGMPDVFVPKKTQDVQVVEAYFERLTAGDVEGVYSITEPGVDLTLFRAAKSEMIRQYARHHNSCGGREGYTISESGGSAEHGRGVKRFTVHVKFKHPERYGCEGAAIPVRVVEIDGTWMLHR